MRCNMFANLSPCHMAITAKQYDGLVFSGGGLHGFTMLGAMQEPVMQALVVDHETGCIDWSTCNMIA